MSVEKCIIEKDSPSFTTTPNKVLQGLKNYEALGLYCYISSLPPQWVFYRENLQKHSGIGRDKLNKLLKILVEHNLLVITQIRSNDGSFSHNSYNVKDGLDFKIPVETKNKENLPTPITEKPLTANQLLVNSTYKENNNKLNKNKKSFCGSKEKNAIKKPIQNSKKHSWAEKPKPPLASVETQSTSYERYPVLKASPQVHRESMIKVREILGTWRV